MKILFVCTCLEPGRDGVGDYSRRLASELEARGYSCSLMALSDPHVTAATQTGNCLRLPPGLSWSERILAAQKFRDNFAPDWISWQFVLYGYDPRGLSFGLGGHLGKIAAGFRNHIMFHEIWIGEASQSSLKFKLIGRLQKFIFRDLLRKIRPSVVHTHTPLYQYFLGQIGCASLRLPLFGNIPLTPNPRSEWLREKWPGFNPADRDGWWIFLIFGSIHPEWDAEDFLRRAAEAAQRAGKKCAFFSIGRQGPAGEQKWQALKQRAQDACILLNLGPQPEEDVSQSLFAVDFGVSAMPPEYLFKSGTAAAMIEHGLHFIATRPVYDYPGCPREILVARLQNIVTDFNLEGLQKTKVGSLLPGVTDQFLGDLQAARVTP